MVNRRSLGLRDPDDPRTRHRLSAERPAAAAGTTVLPRRVDVGWAERYAESVANQPERPVRLSLERVAHFELLAETRLLGALARARREQRDVEIITGIALDLAGGRPERLVKLLRDTLAGVLLAQLATSIVDPAGRDHAPEIRRLQGSTAIERDGIFGFGREWAAPLVDVFGGPPAAALVTSDDSAYQPLFHERVNRMGLGPLTDISLESLVEFSYEAFDNTRQHGARTLDGVPIEGLRFIVHRVLNVERDALNDLAARVDFPALSRFLATLAAQLEARTQLRLVEMTVADSGIGIPARMAGSEEVYAGAYEDELGHTKRAFELSLTTRHSPAGRGRGLRKITRATEKVEGLLTLRTGRTHLYRDFLLGDSGWCDETRAHLPGTSISMLFPWRAERQMSLDLQE
jgi:hypothetical protein